jgi:hypothetical protein
MLDFRCFKYRTSVNPLSRLLALRDNNKTHEYSQNGGIAQSATSNDKVGGQQTMQNTHYETPVSKACAVSKLKGRGSKTRQSRLKSLTPPPLW